MIPFLAVVACPVIPCDIRIEIVAVRMPVYDMSRFFELRHIESKIDHKGKQFVGIDVALFDLINDLLCFLRRFILQFGNEGRH